MGGASLNPRAILPIACGCFRENYARDPVESAMPVAAYIITISPGDVTVETLGFGTRPVFPLSAPNNARTEGRTSSPCQWHLSFALTNLAGTFIRSIAVQPVLVQSERI
jgi:hypothetical protein